MNWLAHLYLSPADASFRIGNLLPDFARPPELQCLPAPFQRGIVRHRLIDAFTDSHPVPRRSISRFEPPVRRFAAIVVDVIYDHFLSVDWPMHASQDLISFIEEVHASIDSARGHLPPELHERLCTLRAGNWLSSYGDLSGVSAALSRIALRLRKPVDLSAAVDVLERDYEAFQADFRTFFPELKARVAD